MSEQIVFKGVANWSEGVSVIGESQWVDLYQNDQRVGRARMTGKGQIEFAVNHESVAEQLRVNWRGFSMGGVAVGAV